MLARGLARLWLALLIVGLLGFATAALAQSEPDYGRWDSFASQVESTLDSNRANDDTLISLRKRVVTWRNEFAAAQKNKSTRLTVLKDQIAALGPAPAEGATEPEDVASRRKELNEALAVEQVPEVRASEAFSRADALVAEIDKTQRARQASAVLHRAPSPLFPGNWAAAVGDGMALITGLLTDTDDAIRAAGGWRGLLQPLSIAGGLLVLAILLVGIGRRWVDWLPNSITVRMSEGAGGAARFLISLTQILLPVAGVWLATKAVEASTLTGLWAQPFLDAAPVAGVIFFSGRWLLLQLAPANGALPAVLGLMPPRRAAVRREGQLLAAVLAIHYLISRPLLPLSSANGTPPEMEMVPLPFSEAAAAVVHFPFIVLGSLALFRVGHLLRRSYLRPDDTTPGYRLLAGAAWLSRPVALAAPLVAAAGYVTMANSVLWPDVITLALIGTVLLVEDFLSDLWSLIRGRAERSSEELAPIVIGFALFIMAVPILALIWGAREADLGEWWAQAAQGVRIGTIRLSPAAILTFLTVFIVGIMITRALQGVVGSSVLTRTRIDKGGKNAIISGLGYIGAVLAALFAITSAGIDFSSIAIVAGALSVGIGFGLQNIVSNFVSGIILLMERPITLGDWIQVGNTMGTVERISVRSTIIKTFDRTDVVVPNSDLITQQVTNWTRRNLMGRLIITVSVSLNSDTRLVSRILSEIAEAQPTVMIDPPPQPLFSGFSPDRLDFELRVILSDINQVLSVASEIRHEIVERFREEGIEIPVLQRDILVRNAGMALTDSLPVIGGAEDKGNPAPTG